MRFPALETPKRTFTGPAAASQKKLFCSPQLFHMAHKNGDGALTKEILVTPHMQHPVESRCVRKIP